MFLLASGPGGALSERWRPPAPGGHYLNHLAAGAHMVFASLLRCTDALCGLRVRPDDSVDAIALPIK
jgi:hypothetical protein